MVGSIYYGIARSSGLNFWESFLYSAAGSFVWEIAGETTNPSINDMIATSIGGTFLGEPFFRMATLLLEDSDGKDPVSGENSAQRLSHPQRGFNRLVFGDKFDAVFPSQKPATFMRLQAGGTFSSSSRNVSSAVEETGAVADFTLSYARSLASQARVTAAHSIILTFTSLRLPPMHWKASTFAGFLWG